MPLNLETFIQQLQEFVGLGCHGQVSLSMTKASPSNHTIVTIAIGSCAKSWDMAPTTEANPQPSPSRPTSPSQSSSDSSLNTSTLSLVIYDGTDGPTMNSRRLGSLLPLLEERGGSLEGVTIRLLNEKVSLTIPKEASPTS